MHSTKRLILVVVLLCVLGIGLVATTEQAVSTSPVGPIWQIERARPRPTLPSGAAFSADGKAIGYLGMREGDAENSLLLSETETGKETLLLGPRDVFMPMDPSFSPDGNRIAFVLIGTSWSYPADIYTIDIVSGGLRKLTQSVSCTERPKKEPVQGENSSCSYYQRYHYDPRYSPNGTWILLHLYDVTEQIRHFTAIMKPDGSKLEILAEGHPAGWSNNGEAVFYTHNGLLTRMDVDTRATRTVPLPTLENGKLLGRMKGRDWFAFRLDNGRIGWYTFEGARATPEYLGEWSVPGFKMAGTERLELKGFDWSTSNEVLLWYQGETTERFEVVRIFEPTRLSR